MESALYGIYALVVFVSEILLVCCAHSFDFWYVNNSCVNTLRQQLPWSILYMATRTWWFVTTSCLCIHGKKLLSNLTRVISLCFWRHLILSVPTRQTFQASYGSKTVDNLTRGTQTCAQNGGSKNQKMGVTLSCLWLDHRSFCPENPMTLRGLLRNKWLSMSYLSKKGNHRRYVFKCFGDCHQN